MYNKVKILVIGFLLLLIGLSYFCLEYYSRPIKDITKLKTELHLSSEKLLGSFRSNIAYANSIYVEKIIEVEGVIKEVIFTNDRYTIVLQGHDDLSYIVCDMLHDNIDVFEKLKPGQTVHLKGICKGFLRDVIMLNCIVVNQ